MNILFKLIVSLILCSNIIFSQANVPRYNAPSRQSTKLNFKIGFEGGVTQGFISGNYSDPAYTCNYLFSSGKSLGYNFGLVFTLPLSTNSEIFFTGGFSNSEIKSTNEKIIDKVVRYEPDPVSINMKGNLNIKTTSLNYSIYFKRKIFSNNFFFVIGGGGESIIKNDVTVDENINDPGLVFLYNLNPSNLLTYENNSTIINKIQFSGNLGFGNEFIIKNKLAIVPQIIFSYPVSKLIKESTLKVIKPVFKIQFLWII